MAAGGHAGVLGRSLPGLRVRGTPNIVGDEVDSGKAKRRGGREGKGTKGTGRRGKEKARGTRERQPGKEKGIRAMEWKASADADKTYASLGRVTSK